MKRERDCYISPFLSIDRMNYMEALEHFVVGKKYEKYASGKDGVVFDVDDAGATLIVSFKRPTSKEIEQFASGKSLKIKCTTLKNTIMMLIKIGDLSWMDAPYNPDLSTSLTTLPDPEDGEGLAITVMLFDAVDGELKAMRLISATTEFTKKFFQSIEEISLQKITYENYMKYINQLYIKYKTKDFLRMSSFGFQV